MVVLDEISTRKKVLMVQNIEDSFKTVSYFFKGFNAQQLKQPPLKMAATGTDKTSGIFHLRTQPTSPEDVVYNDTARKILN